MMESGNNILVRFKRRWQLKRWIEILLYAIGPATLVYFLSFNIYSSVFTLVIVIAIIAFLFKPWKLSLKLITKYVDQHLESAEYSTGLLLLPEEQLTRVARLQRYNITKELNQRLSTVKPPDHLLRGVLILGAFLLIAFFSFQFNLMSYLKGSQSPVKESEKITFTSGDSTATRITSPKLESQVLTIRYPRYTRIPALNTSEMDIKAVEGSRLLWKLQFNTDVQSVVMESLGNEHPMKLVDGKYILRSVVHTSGFYNFKFIDNQGVSYTSDLYAIKMIEDQSPVVEIKELKQFTTFSFGESKNLSFTTSISDDFGIADTYIIATVSKGSGESVKFREEKLGFDTKFSKGNKKLNLSKKINLDQMKMEPGDELYFYVEAVDQKQPKPNKSRSETFFAVIKDTVSDQFAVEGTMGVDLMPDYFRSQRQLIIDTEKLLSDKPKLTEKDFKFKSNELGFDQKVLRLKYAEFMGDESEFSEATEENTENHVEEDHDHEEDPLAQYTHKHDSENEHNLVEEKKEGNSKEDPLSEYLHNHQDPEESTLFTQSLKSKLRQALNEMWDAELYLRLYTPEKSLPYQYKALKLIQEIKNSARIYVHRIGFDPPPIKEDKRLTGKIDEVSNYQKNAELTIEKPYSSIREAILKLEELIEAKEQIENEDRKLFELAGNELATKAIENPGKYLKTLQQLKWLTENREISISTLTEIQNELILILPELEPNPIKRKVFTSDINKLLLKELEIHE
ncbi:tryptophan-rich sensory protein [Aquimarina sp. 2201CG5-10]|uniref:tryptophan-rich sensory protein n=1 Tax=Aquimarina callyspongiae TaxID=3098150 RepID=UPI002AB3F334|nr:tryptophan-rich sensory protein [Aquimarina sp. 2201CG5-10]MDY8137973.1 tryptophan-rich sensory protein [Aquimarina sp. 2201CG5-10]